RSAVGIGTLHLDFPSRIVLAPLRRGFPFWPAGNPAFGVWLILRAVVSLTRRSQRLSFLIAFTQYLFDSLHDWHLKILLVAAIIGHLAHIRFEGMQINHSVIAFGIIVTAEPGSDKPRLTDFVMHELVTVDFCNVDRHLGMGRPGGCKGKDGYQGDIDALPWHKTLLSRNRNFHKATHRLCRLYQALGRLRPGVQYSGAKMGGTPNCRRGILTWRGQAPLR